MGFSAINGVLSRGGVSILIAEGYSLYQGIRECSSGGTVSGGFLIHYVREKSLNVGDIRDRGVVGSVSWGMG